MKIRGNGQNSKGKEDGEGLKVGNKVKKVKIAREMKEGIKKEEIKKIQGKN